MTWKQFKDEVERQGVTDATDLAYVDFNHTVVLVQHLRSGSVTITGRFKTVDEEEEEERLKQGRSSPANSGHSGEQS